MQAIILAAGMGKRLGEYTQGNTKCMVKVCGETLIERMLKQLRIPISLCTTGRSASLHLPEIRITVCAGVLQCILLCSIWILLSVKPRTA